MKGTVSRKLRFLAAVTALASLLSFSNVYGEYYNDEKFEVYSNMSGKSDGIMYIVPNLYRQDAAYPYVKDFPVVVTGGIEYVPISMFSLYSYINVTYSKVNDNFYMINTKTNEYLSFDVSQGIAATSHGDTLEMETRIFHRTRYIPARTVAQIMGVTCETYDDPKKGIYALRISDQNASYTFDALLRQYLPESYLPEKSDEVSSENPQDKPPSIEPEKETDPILSVANRQVAIMFEAGDENNTANTLKVITDYGMSAAFSVNRDYILSCPSDIRKIITGKHSFSVTLSEQEVQTVTKENAKEQVIAYLEEANEALYTVSHRKTRLCTLPESIIQLFESESELDKLLSDNGYVMFCANVIADNTKSAFSVYTELSQGVVNAYPKNKSGLVKMIIPCSSNSRSITANLAKFISNYPNFTAIGADETMA